VAGYHRTGRYFSQPGHHRRVRGEQRLEETVELPAQRPQYDALVLVSHGVGNPRRPLVVACAVVVLGTVVLAWYATQTVRPDCVVAISRITGGGRTLPDASGHVPTASELFERAYRDALASGRCEPPAARWRQWIG
jgi:hypothetical protein